MSWRLKILGTLILLLATSLRFYHLDKIPNGFFFDEATIAYQAYSLIKTGHDTWNQAWPIFSFKDYGEHILPVGIYGQIPSILIGGLTVYAARFPHALLGVLAVLMVMLLGKIQFSKRTGLLAGFLLAVSPLAIGWNRFVYEGNFGTLFFLIGVLCFSIFLKTRRLLPISGLFFGLAMLSYHIFLVIVPLFGIVLFFFYHREITTGTKRTLIITGVIALLFSLWALGSVYSGAGRQRFKQAATLLSPEKIDVINHYTGYCRQDFNPTLCRVVYSKAITLPLAYLENYATHFSPQFLGFDGTFFRQNILPKTGLILFPEIITLAAGIFFLLRSNNKYKGVLLGWLVIYPFANSFTGLGEISRIAFAAPLFALLSAEGLNELIKQNRLFKLFALPLLLAAILFFFAYFQIFPRTNAYYTDYGFDKLYSFINSVKNQYQNIYISSGYAGTVPSISAQFFMPIDPHDFSDPKKIVRTKDVLDYYHVTQANNLIFYSSLKEISPTNADLIVLSDAESKNITVKPIFSITDPIGQKLLSVYPVADIK